MGWILSLPIYRDDNQPFQLMQSRWSAELNPILALPILNGNMLNNISLAIGATVIPHKLGRKLQGWVITDINAASTIYRSGTLNDKTLALTSSAVCVVDIWVF